MNNSSTFIPKERPILMRPELVRATLERRKKETRRILKFQPPDDRPPIAVYHSSRDRANGTVERLSGVYGDGWNLKCPYGSPGDRLWVRETWSPMPEHRPIPDPTIYDDKPAWYRADNNRPTWAGTKWRPSIFMPRAACRILLEVLSIKVERLLDITEDAAYHEGAPDAPNPDFDEDDPGGENPFTFRAGFLDLWNSINGKGAWEKNPWVWVVGFKLVKQQ